MEFQKNMLKQNNFQQQQSCNQTSNHHPVDQKWRKNKNTGLSVFIAKTFEILESNSYSDIIAWNQLGTNFTIVNVEKFQTQILPIYFRHRNFSSFVRQLNMYDFHKIRNQKNLSIFQHKQFRRNSKQSLIKIKRKGCTFKKGNKQLIKRQDQSYDFQQKIEPTQIKNNNYHQINKQEQKIKKTKNIEKQKDQQFLSNELSLKDIKDTQVNVCVSRNSFKNKKANYNKNKTQVSINNFDENQNQKLDSKQKLSIPSSFNISYNINRYHDQSPAKIELIEEFMSKIPQIFYNQWEIQQKIKELKQNPRYKCLNSKDQLRKIYKKLKNRKIFDDKQNQLQDLSIQQEIAVQNMDKNFRMKESQEHKRQIDQWSLNNSSLYIPVMALVPTEKFLPNRSISLIGSLAYLNHGQDFDALMHGFH